MNVFKLTQSTITAILLILLGNFGGYYLGIRGYEVNIKEGIGDIKIVQKENIQSQQADFGRFWEVWNSVNSKHIKKPLDQSKLVNGAITGMVAAIGDPYTSYFEPAENTAVLNSLNGLYEGIGAQLGFSDEGQLIIVAPLDGSPALLSGVKSGDRILAIEGISTVGLSIEGAVDKIRGEAGTAVVLNISRDDVLDSFDIRIVRDTIKLDSVTWEDKSDGIAYIRLSRFGGSTNVEWSKVVDEIIEQMPLLSGVILDVRDNPGGFLDSAVFISSEFVKDGVVVREEISDGRSNQFKVDHVGKFTDDDLKIVVLLNQGSASASEIVAGALKERRQALIVGVRSFGKGTVQKSEEYADGASLHVTIAKWLTPDGNWVDKHNSEFEDSQYNEIKDGDKDIIGGLKPDVEIGYTDEDIKNENDPQLNKSIEIIKSDGFSQKTIITKIIEEIKAKL